MLAVGAIVAAMLAACSGFPFMQSVGCASWVAYDTPADAMADATAVVVGHVTTRAGSGKVLGTDAHAWTVDVERWAKGSGEASIRVLSTPVGCGGQDPYPDGDPFQDAVGNRSSVLFLFRGEGAWRGMTPLQAVIPATPSGGIPDAWPPGTAGSPAAGG